MHTAQAAGQEGPWGGEGGALAAGPLLEHGVRLAARPVPGPISSRAAGMLDPLGGEGAEVPRLRGVMHTPVPSPVLAWSWALVSEGPRPPGRMGAAPHLGPRCPRCSGPGPVWPRGRAWPWSCVLEVLPPAHLDRPRSWSAAGWGGALSMGMLCGHGWQTWGRGVCVQPAFLLQGGTVSHC